MRRLLTAWLLLALAATAAAQTTTTFTDRLVLADPPAKSSETACLWRDSTTGMVATGACPTGTVTSVGLSLPGIFSVSGSPVTTSGTLTASLVSQTQNLVWASPNGSSGAPTFRALADADVPDNLTLGTVSGNPSFTGNVTLGDATADTVALTGRLASDVVPSSGYSRSLGAATLKLLAVHAAELQVDTLVAQDVMATVGGRVLVAPTTVLTADLSSGATSITVKHNNLANGDRVYLEGNGQVEALAITSGASGSAGAYVYSVTRNLDGTGADTWYAGDAVVSTTPGFIDIYSTRGVKAGTELGPTIVGNVRLSSTWNDWAPRWALGQLQGLYGYGASTYGAAFGDPSGSHVTIDATNGIRFRQSTTVLGTLASSEWVLGNTATENVRITSTALEMRDGTTVRASLDGSTLTLGSASTENVQVTSSGISLRYGSTTHASLVGSTLTLGLMSALNTGRVVIDSDSVDVQWKNGSGVTETPFSVDTSSGTTRLVLRGLQVGGTNGRSLRGLDDGDVKFECTGAVCAVTIGSQGVGPTIIQGRVLRPLTSDQTLGDATNKWDNIHLNLPSGSTTYTYAVVGDPTTPSKLAYYSRAEETITIAGCAMTFRHGLLINKSGCS